MLIVLSRETGSLIVSDRVVACPRCIELDGRAVARAEYPELFRAWHVDRETVRLPDMRGYIQGAGAWVIAKPEPCDGCAFVLNCCLHDDGVHAG